MKLILGIYTVRINRKYSNNKKVNLENKHQTISRQCTKQNKKWLARKHVFTNSILRLSGCN